MTKHVSTDSVSTRGGLPPPEIPPVRRHRTEAPASGRLPAPGWRVTTRGLGEIPERPPPTSLASPSTRPPARRAAGGRVARARRASRPVAARGSRGRVAWSKCSAEREPGVDVRPVEGNGVGGESWVHRRATLHPATVPRREDRRRRAMPRVPPDRLLVGPHGGGLRDAPEGGRGIRVLLVRRDRHHTGNGIEVRRATPRRSPRRSRPDVVALIQTIREGIEMGAL